jgi:hypothetical protein
MSEKLTVSQAQIVANLFRKFFQEIVEPLDSKFTAYVVALTPIKQTHPEAAEAIDVALNVVGTSPALRDLMHQRYHVTLEKYLQQFVEHAQDVESLEQMIRDLTQTSLN